MKVFTIVNHASILAYPNQEAAVAAEQPDRGDELFWTLTGLENIANDMTGKELVSIWNGLPGVKAVSKFENRPKAAKRIWDQIQALPVAEEAPAPVAGTIEKVEGGFEITQTVDPLTGEPIEEEETMKTKKTKKAAKKETEATKRQAETTKRLAAKAPKALNSDGVRAGTKHAEVIALLKRKNGATIVEIMNKMGWQRHTVRGFMAGAMRKAGFEVESFKPEGGERTYRLPS